MPVMSGLQDALEQDSRPRPIVSVLNPIRHSPPHVTWLGLCEHSSNIMMNFESPREKLQEYTWLWDTKSVSDQATHGPTHLSDERLEVTFHTSYSSGTEGVRGDAPLIAGCDHFWEIKILSVPYGTDMMVGVGTDKVDLSRREYCSLLGMDGESWGLSYRGSLHHNNEQLERYGPNISKNDIIGIHLNTWNNNLTYYVNGVCLGIAFNLPPGKVVYPMACATAAFSRIRLIYAFSLKASLQTLCLQSMSSDKDKLSDVRSIPGLCSQVDRTCLDCVWAKPLDATQTKTGFELVMGDYDDDCDIINQRAGNSRRQKRKKSEQFLPALSFRERCDMRFSHKKQPLEKQD